jgi:hypothetical protein
MSLYAATDTSNVFVQWVDYSGSTVPTGYKPATIDSFPGFDPNTQKVVEGTPIITNGTARKTWSVVPLSQNELNDLADSAERAALDLLKADLKNGVGTNAERIARNERFSFLLFRACKKANII